MRALTLRTAAVLAIALLPGPAIGQVANPLAGALGMGGNYTAVARGLSAPAWNPAGLGMPDNPGWSFSVIPLATTVGLGPLTPADLADYEGQLIPRQTRIDWLNLIAEEGGEKGSLGVDVTYAAFSIGRFAFSATSSARGRVNMAPDAVELIFFGNAGRDPGNVPGDYTLEGSAFDVAGTTTFAASMAIPVSVTLGPLPDQHFAVGATLKYTMGNFLVMGRETQSSVQSDPLSVDIRFPVVHTPFPDDSVADRSWGDVLNNGAGVGLDVGAAWQGGIFSAGLVVKNLFNTFEWDLDDLEYREGEALWNADTARTSFQEVSVATAPPEVIDRLETLYEFSPMLAAGAAARVLPNLTVTGDIRHSLEENLSVGPRSHVGIGAELTVLPVLPLRAGLAVISGGYQLSGGLGLRLGPVQLAASGALQDTDVGGDGVYAFGLTFGLP